MAIDRTAHATWEGDLRSGSGRFDLQSSGAISGEEVTYASRFEQDSGGKTSPEELIAAAHATCFSMALAKGLAQDGHAPTKLETNAEVTLDNSGGGFAISKIQLTVRGEVEGLDDDQFRRAAEQAKEDCPVSKALASVPEITLDASLAQQEQRVAGAG
jgi:lipoyl-dependent peroxiredoxin